MWHAGSSAPLHRSIITAIHRCLIVERLEDLLLSVSVFLIDCP